MRVAFAAALFGLVVSQEALADWQYTRWGMTLDDLRVVPGVTISAATPKQREVVDRGTGGRLEASAPYEASSLKLTAFFYFKENKLTKVELRTTGRDADLLIRRIADVYGRPDSSDSSSVAGCEMKTASYRDAQRNNLVDTQLFNCSGKEDGYAGTIAYRAFPRSGDL